MSSGSNKRKASEIAVNMLETYIKRSDERAGKIEMMLQKADERAERAESLLVALTKKIDERDTTTAFDASLESIVKSSNNAEEEEQQEEEDLSNDEESVVDEKDKWVGMYQQLRGYRILNGDCKVPDKFAENRKLGKWVSFQKACYNNVKTRKGNPKIKPDKIIKLDSLGFNWGKKYPPPVSWDDMFEQLHTFQQRMGNCNVPFNSTNPTPLAKWAAYQRSEYKRWKKGHDSLLTLDQIGRLKDIGMNWKGPRL